MSRRVLTTTLALASVGLGLLAARPRPAPSPPVADVRPHEVVSPHGVRKDPYYWLRDDTRSRPDVLAYLTAENAYYEAMTAGQRPLVRRIAGEMAARLPAVDSTVPYRDRSHLYFERHEAQREYPVVARRSRSGDLEEVLVDGNREAEGQSYSDVDAWAVSSSEDVLAFLHDTGGRYQYTLRFRDIATGRDYPERIPGLRPDVAWAGDNRTAYYVENDPVTLLSRRVKKHALGTDPATDPVVYEEKDTSFYVNLEKSRDQRFVLIHLESTEADEWWAIDAERPASAPRCLAPRERGVHYGVQHAASRWVIRTDRDAPNYRVMTAGDEEIGDRARWRDFLPHDPGVFVDEIVAFRGHLAVAERREGVLGLRVVAWDDPKRSFRVPTGAPTSTLKLSTNAESDTSVLRYVESSLVTPATEYEVDMETRERRLLKRQSVPRFAPEDYATERVWAPARDG
ncbi:MAG TPA: S9 family peptidase, partial [Vicinamibacteria bacterium]